ncbi:HTH domain-containing protein, partial [Candidatus Pacearchaeota archaeon]|nr:HTH domain-containing protein [Candidatus Pacearchaeota archaeon]
MDEIKEAFLKVKQDMLSLGQEISSIKIQMQNVNDAFEELKQYLKLSESTKTYPRISSAIPTHNPTHLTNPTDDMPLKASKSQNLGISTGNEGVPTNKPTNQQTNQHIIRKAEYPLEEVWKEKDNIDNQTGRINRVLNSLDALKKETRLKFKRLTQQEMSVFSLLYHLEEQGEDVNYRILSSKLSLSESSIRDYIAKIQKKGIPVEKKRINNKKILLYVSPELKKIASLSTIM